MYGIANVTDWCGSHRLQLNIAKTNIMWFGSSASLQSIPSSDRSVIVGQDTIEACDSARNLVVQFDCEMSMRAQIAKTTQFLCFFHLQRLRQVRRLLRRQVACSATRHSTQSTLAPLQRVLRSASTRTRDQCADRFTLASCCCTYRIQDMRASVPGIEQYCTSVHFRHAAASLHTSTSN